MHYVAWPDVGSGKGVGMGSGKDLQRDLGCIWEGFASISIAQEVEADPFTDTFCIGDRSIFEQP